MILRTENGKNNATTLSARFLLAIILALMTVLVYGWTIFEPLAGDALMHVMDSSRIDNVHDLFATLMGYTNHGNATGFRLDIFHRPVFNDWYISALKHVFGIAPIWFRTSTLVLQCASGLIIFSLFGRLAIPLIPSFLGAVSLLFAPALFFGLYEFAISFSQLMMFLALTSLYFGSCYTASKKPVQRLTFAVLTFLVTFLVVFTKESAVLWPIVVIGFIFCLQISEDRKDLEITISRSALTQILWPIFRKNLLLFAPLILIPVIYFVTRYHKLGSLTAIAAGIEGSVTILDSFHKFFGYILYGMGVPNSVNESYLSIPVAAITGLELWLHIGLFLLYACGIVLTFKKSKAYFLFTCLVLFCTFLPIIKVTRNSPYYGDLMSIGFAFFIAFGFSLIQASKKKLLASVLAGVFIFCAVGQSLYMSKRYVSDSRVWLALSQGIARAALSDVASNSAFADASHIVEVGPINEVASMWALNYSSELIGSGFYANIGIPMAKFSAAKSDDVPRPNTMYMEFHNDGGFRSTGSTSFPGFGRLTTTYFPGDIAVAKIDSDNGSYHLALAKVVRLECDKKTGADNSINFPITFVDTNGSEFVRTVNDFYNVSAVSSKFVAQFIVPLNSINFNFGQMNLHACLNPKVEGFSSVVRSIDQFNKMVSADPYFNDAALWVGALQRVPGGGVHVGPGASAANVISQRVSVIPGHSYLIKATAYSSGKEAHGRLQVNWHAKDEKYLSTASLTFLADKQKVDVHLLAKAPKDAAFGILYVSPHSDVDELEFTMMSMSGSD